MADSVTDVDRMFELVGAVCDGTASEDDVLVLDSMVVADESLRRDYWDYCRMDVTFGMEARIHRALRNVHERDGGDFSALAPWESDALAGTISPPVAAIFPPPAFPANLWHGTVTYFSSGWPLAYLIATMIFTTGMLVAAFTYVSQPDQVAVQPPSVGEKAVVSESQSAFVGRITGMVDCQWATNTVALAVNDTVPVGREIKLESGLMEITYNSGAQVILQGPVTYEVESRDGGFLSAGKLTARVDKGSEIEDKRSDVPHPLFAVRTPTAKVTDLGTEFGVAVDKDGQTVSHVFRGSVKVQLLTAAAGREAATVLHENQTSRTERSDTGWTIVVQRVAADPATFVRRMVRPVKMLDLLDIVAGGNGLGHCRERGIDPSTAMEDPVFVATFRHVDRGYRRATTYRYALIDGLFLPDGSQGAVQLDSADHTFVGFPKADGKWWGSIWSRAALGKPAERYRPKKERRLVYCIDGDERFTPERRGLLCFPCPIGITFDIAVMRKAYSTVRPARFRAVAGVGDVSAARMPDESRSDLWIFVDGQLRLQRMRMGPQDGVVRVDVGLGPDDRFLTLVCTDSAGTRSCGFSVFGDPVLELVPVEEGRL